MATNIGTTTIMLALLSMLVGVNGSQVKIQNTRPIIGILAQDPGLRKINRYGASFISAAYVKLVESGGARVVPIFANQTEAYYRKMFKSINGVLIPGGGPKVFDKGMLDTDISRSSALMFSYAIESYEQGDYFPILGVCFGFEILAMMMDSVSCLTHNLSAINITVPLTMTPGYETSKMFGKSSTPPEIISILTSQNITYNSHKKGVTKETFLKRRKLTEFYQILSTNKDLNGVEFVSTIEAYDYPIYGLIWHPEKNPYEWAPELGIPHTADALKVSHYMADFFIGEARKNNHTFGSEEEETAALIYHYEPIYTGDIYPINQLSYMFQHDICRAPWENQ